MNMISSSSFYNLMREPILRLQGQIARTELEVSNGKRADIGLDLGRGAGTALAAENQLSACKASIVANDVVVARISETQSGLSAISAVGQTLRQQLIEASAATSTATALQANAAGAIGQLQLVLNTKVHDVFIFGGVNSSVRPLADYSAGPPKSPAKAAVDAAFLSNFGFTQDDPRVSGISGDAMLKFIDKQYAEIFTDTAWKANWSSASDRPIQSRMQSGSPLAISVSANDAGIRNLTKAAVIASDLGFQLLSSDARKVLIDAATTMASNGLDQIAESQSRMGVVQNRFELSSSYLSAQSTFLQGRIDQFEFVDPAAASMQLTTLSTQLQSAYALTARISALSLLKYI